MLTVVKPVVVNVLGELDLDNQRHFEQAVLQRLASASVVLDLSGLTFLSISALRSLEVCSAAAEASGRQFGLASPSAPVRRLLTLAGMDHLLQCPPSMPSGNSLDLRT